MKKTSGLDKNFFVNNRLSLRKSMVDKLPLVISGNGILQRTADNNFPFVQESNFWYLTGLDTPDCVLIIDENDEFLIVPNRSTTRQAFDGSLNMAAISERSGIEKIVDETEGWQVVKNKVKTTDKVSYLKPISVYDSHHGLFANPARRRVADRLRRFQQNIKMFDARTEMAKLRSIKQTCEIQMIEKAVDITKATLAELISSPNFANCRYEYELEAAITYGFRSRGAMGHAYNPIVAAGHNATTLHYGANNSELSKNDCIVIDVGAEVEHYAADITRTVTLSDFTARQKSIFESVEFIQNEALNLLKPGVLMRNYENQIEQIMGSELKKLGLIADATDHLSIRKYYPHSTSHFLGLDVHDVGDYHEPLAEGMVMTCEPGIYIPEEGIGVRIEDDVLITKSGNRVL